MQIELYFVYLFLLVLFFLQINTWHHYIRTIQKCYLSTSPCYSHSGHTAMVPTRQFRILYNRERERTPSAQSKYNKSHKSRMRAHSDSAVRLSYHSRIAEASALQQRSPIKSITKPGPLRTWNPRKPLNRHRTSRSSDTLEHPSHQAVKYIEITLNNEPKWHE